MKLGEVGRGMWVIPGCFYISSRSTFDRIYGISVDFPLFTYILVDLIGKCR